MHLSELINQDYIHLQGYLYVKESVLTEKFKVPLAILTPGAEAFSSGSSAGPEGVPELFRRIQSWIPLQEPTMKEKKAYCLEYGIMNDLAEELFDECNDFGTLDNKILEVRIAVIKY